jgi:hypothetical protein
MCHRTKFRQSVRLEVGGRRPLVFAGSWVATHNGGLSWLGDGEEYSLLLIVGGDFVQGAHGWEFYRRDF